MLIKLIKYDFKSMLRIFVPLWISLLVVSVVNRFTIRLSSNYMTSTLYGHGSNAYGVYTASNSIASLVAGLVMFLFGILITAMFVIAAIIIVQRFYTGLLRDEGYLMFTLPVSPGQLVLSKGLAASILLLVNCLVTFMAIVILSAGPEWSEFFATLREYIQLYNLGNISFLITLCVISAIVAIVYGICMIYTSMALGHLAKRHRILLSFVAYIGISWGVSIISSLTMSIFNSFAVSNELWFVSIIEGFVYPARYNDFSGIVSLTNWMLGINTIFSLMLTVIFFFTTRHILSKKLNLE